jgi:hypothetical protein
MPAGATASAGQNAPAAQRVAARSALAFPAQAWAGWVAVPRHGKPIFRSVTATFVVPPLSCATTPNAGAIQGVSLDGFSDSTMEQAGVSETCDNGVASYLAGWQMPGLPIFAGIFAVHASDEVRATVTYDLHRTYTLAVQDLVSHQSFSDRETCTVVCDNSTAEIITQANPPHPPAGPGVLADFAKLLFTRIEISDSVCPTPGPLRRPACWLDKAQTMTPAPGHHHATPGPITAADLFGNVWSAAP